MQRIAFEYDGRSWLTIADGEPVELERDEIIALARLADAHVRVLAFIFDVEPMGAAVTAQASVVEPVAIEPVVLDTEAGKKKRAPGKRTNRASEPDGEGGHRCLSCSEGGFTSPQAVGRHKMNGLCPGPADPAEVVDDEEEEPEPDEDEEDEPEPRAPIQPPPPVQRAQPLNDRPAQTKAGIPPVVDADEPEIGDRTPGGDPIDVAGEDYFRFQGLGVACPICRAPAGKRCHRINGSAADLVATG